MELILGKFGDSLGIVLPKEALAHLNAQEDDTISITESVDGSLRICASKRGVSGQVEVAQDVMHRYHDTLRELAK